MTAYHGGIPARRASRKETAELVTRWTPLAPGEYILTAPIRVPSGATVDLTNITLRYPPRAEFQSLLDIAGSSNVEVIGGAFDGNVNGQPTWREQQHAIQ